MTEAKGYSAFRVARTMTSKEDVTIKWYVEKKTGKAPEVEYEDEAPKSAAG